MSMSPDLALNDLDDKRIKEIRPLIPPQILVEDIPLTLRAAQTIVEGRQAAENIIKGQDDRLLVIVGPCSIHDVNAAKEYGEYTISKWFLHFVILKFSVVWTRSSKVDRIQRDLQRRPLHYHACLLWETPYYCWLEGFDQWSRVEQQVIQLVRFFGFQTPQYSSVLKQTLVSKSTRASALLVNCCWTW